MSRALTLTKLSGVTITPTGLRASKQLSDEEWLQVGAQIGRIGNALQWASGDWWAYGEDRKYGDGRACAEHVGVNYDTIRNRAVVCRAFELSRRRDNLSFTHHQEVMAAPAEQYDSWLDRAKKEEW